jgi:hypothetical protein
MEVLRLLSYEDLIHFVCLCGVSSAQARYHVTGTTTRGSLAGHSGTTFIGKP